MGFKVTVEDAWNRLEEQIGRKEETEEGGGENDVREVIS